MKTKLIVTLSAVLLATALAAILVAGSASLAAAVDEPAATITRTPKTYPTITPTQPPEPYPLPYPYPGVPGVASLHQDKPAKIDSGAPMTIPMRLAQIVARVWRFLHRP
jgi:hypothetical protein